MVQDTRHITFETFETYAQRRENADRLLELIQGEIVEKVPTEEHGIIVANILTAMNVFVKQHKLGRVTTESLHRLPGDDENAVLPDVSFRSNVAAPVVRRGAVPTLPDLAVEVQSPSQSEDFMVQKANYYLAGGTHLVWLVFPGRRVVEVHLPDTVQTLTENDVLTGGDVLPGFEMPVNEVFDLG